MSEIRCNRCESKVADRCLSETALGNILGSQCRRCATPRTAVVA